MAESQNPYQFVRTILDSSCYFDIFAAMETLAYNLVPHFGAQSLSLLIPVA